MKPAAALIAISLIAAAAQPASAAPSADAAARAEVVGVVNAFFEAMKARDGEAIRKLYLPGAVLVAGSPSKDGYRVSQQGIEAFIPAAANAPSPFVERMWAADVQVDGRTAIVWARYDFHRGSTFSHNGRDVYVLMRTDAGWKIASLVFTVEPGAATEHPEGAPR